MAALQQLGIILLCYGIGCFAAAYYFVKWKKGVDLREYGTGSLGARNAGRLLGKKAYVAVSLADIAKGAAAYSLASWLGARGWWLFAAGIAVIAGHLWPIQLGFHGGKGFATGYGVVIAVAPLIALAMWGVFFLSRPILGRWTYAGLAAFLGAVALAAWFYFRPISVHGWVLQCSGIQSTLIGAIALLILWTHRETLRRERCKDAGESSGAVARGPEPKTHT